MKNANVIVAKNIRQMRHALNLTQAQLADRMGYSVKAVSKWENGQGLPPSAVLPDLAMALKTDINHLFQGTGEPSYFLGIDGGGTKTDFALADKEGNLLRKVTFGPSNPVDVGEKELFKILEEGIYQVCKDISFLQISVHAGIAGCSTGDYPEKLERFFQRFGFSRFSQGGDITNAIALGLGGSDGIAVILGTGAVAFTKTGDKIIKTGGYGYLFDDKGSGFSIGRDALRAVMEWEEGFGQQTLLTEAIRKKCETNRVTKQIPEFYIGGQRLLSSFAPLVFDAWDAGDEVARRILEENMQAVAQLIVHAGRVLSSCRTVPVVLIGGITKRQDITVTLIQKYLEQELKTDNKYRLHVCSEPAYVGALILAGMNKREENENA